MEPLHVGFGRLHIRGWTSQEAAWLVEGSCATQAERMCALPPSEAQRWIRLADVELSARVERRLLDHEVLVLVHRTGARFDVGAPPIDLVPDEGEPIAPIEEPKPWIEVQVRTASGSAAANIRYELALPDGRVVSGQTGADGLIRHDDLRHEGECTVRFPEIEANAAGY